MGPIFQTIYYLIIINYLNNHDYQLLKMYHYSILIFNMLPIYPLDGGKLLNIILSFITSYQKSYILTIFLSFSTIFITIVLSIKTNYSLSLNLYLILSLIIIRLTKAYKDRLYYYNKFKLERYLNNYHFKTLKVIPNINKMMRDKRHIIKKENEYLTEKECLKSVFKYKTKI